MTKTPPANQLKVLLGLSAGLIIAGLPLMNKKVYQREQAVAAMRDATYSSEPQIDKGQAKDAARNFRLKRSA
ncbi:hypothetical protein ACKKBG_A23455 [Auxenochlorella protothecoides x Auxenochlorella symbiontica]